MFKFVGYATPIVAAAAAVSTRSNTIYNESNRRFYEDDVTAAHIPGTVVAAPASEIASLGENRIVDGISVRSTPTTEIFFKTIRFHAVGNWTRFNHWVNQKYTTFNDTERYVASTVSDLHYKREDLLPNGIYVVIAILSGTIAARPRGILAKVAFPTIFGLAAFKYFLPKTFENTREFAWSLEQKNLPEVARQQENAYHSAVGLAKAIEEGTEHSVKRVEEGAATVRRSIAGITGLNLDEEVSKKK
ncbi:hypothetical protein PVL30_001712 [Lodderomyces elongisporus]|uniref:MICOS complex subunit n=1 Tax=Lodderomyces elongisporus (strain ATCC 11503 / CBS 2605 / JCM 1781 / NBRC 1676 / NRRL YB-4239) TaxID=379508 RepID=A5DWJ9_LODEL|nr:uncharacterized protein PVL30_001712 [Lodderomyces elongisporus]EDK43557.1 conserved hypothetical protein [Lodderomyces elongisporus NRRL YB-4239]WLF77986.1 hypothetical protein PVL30_001712 [Lodderomyces elongisporus]